MYGPNGTVGGVPSGNEFFEAFATTMDMDDAYNNQNINQHNNDPSQFLTLQQQHHYQNQMLGQSLLPVVNEAQLAKGPLSSCIMNDSHFDNEAVGVEEEDRPSAPPTPDIISTFANFSSHKHHSDHQSQHQQSSSWSGSSPFLASSDLSSSSSYSDSVLSQITSSGGGRSSAAGSSVACSSVKETRTRLIKEGLKLTIQSKRKAKGLPKDPVNQQMVYQGGSMMAMVGGEEDDSLSMSFSPKSELTFEDEERRSRRRERNKIAATKCRNKKKERTQRLAVESTSLESNNHHLKDEIDRLECEKRNLLDLLQRHVPRCCASPMGTNNREMGSENFSHASNWTDQNMSHCAAL